MAGAKAAALARGIEVLLGRRFLWRLGRSLYLAARRESGNDIATNGERRVQRAAIAAARAQGRTPLVLDVGANYGQWAGALIDGAAEQGAPLTLISFEPVPEVHAALEAALARRAGPGLSLSARRLALADAPGTARFSVMGEGSGTHHLGTDSFDAATRIIEVEVGTVDAFLAAEGLGEVDLLKVDCEGYDPLVLKGARASLAAGRIGAVQFEYNSRWIQSRHYLRDIFTLIDGLPYRLGKVTPGGVEIYGRWEMEMERLFEANYLLVREDRAQAYPLRAVAFDDTNAHG